MDLTHTQASCLMLLAQGETTVSDLARHLNTDAGSATRLLNRMERRGLVTRSRRNADRRVVDLTLTDEGREMALKLPEVFCRVMRNRFKGFSASEIATFRDMLSRIVANGCKTDRITG